MIKINSILNILIILENLRKFQENKIVTQISWRLATRRSERTHEIKIYSKR